MGDQNSDQKKRIGYIFLKNNTEYIAIFHEIWHLLETIFNCFIFQETPVNLALLVHP